MRHSEDRFTTPDGIDLYTPAWLPDDQPQAILLIVHGLGDHSRRYTSYVDYFVPRGDEGGVAASVARMRLLEQVG
jgi:alpha-beta hydrolase superfamily lysophospholipase